MKDTTLLITAHKGAFLIRPFEGLVSKPISFSHRMRHFGTTWNDKRLFLAVGQVGTAVADFDLSFNLLRQKKLKYTKEAHQILWIDDRLYIVNTGWDNVIIWDGKREKIWHPTIPSIVAKPPLKAHVYHFNSIYRVDDRLYLLAHNFGASFLLVYEYPSLKYIKVFTHVGVESHNIFPFNKKSFGVLSSLQGRINSLEKKRFVKASGYTRGIAITENRIFVGCPGYVRSRENRRRCMFHVYIYDREWNYIDKFNIDAMGLVFDIRAIHTRDYAHYEGSEKVKFNLDSVEWRKADKKNYYIIRG